MKKDKEGVYRDGERRGGMEKRKAAGAVL